MNQPASQTPSVIARRWSWARLSSTASTVAVAAFVVNALLAKWAPVQAQEAKQKQKAKALPASPPAALVIP